MKCDFCKEEFDEDVLFTITFTEPEALPEKYISCVACRATLFNSLKDGEVDEVRGIE